jgi:uncharacterized protein
VAEAWKIGRKKIDDGAILVVAKNDRKLRIEVGYGLEGALNDVTAKRIIDEIITPKFRSGDFAGGISSGVDQIIRVVDGEALPAQQRQNSSFLSHIDPFNPLCLSRCWCSAGCCAVCWAGCSVRLRPAAWSASSHGCWSDR